MTPAALTKARAALASLCTSSGQLRRAVNSPDGSGGTSRTWTDEGAPFACCLYSPKGDEVPAPLALLNKVFFVLAWVGEMDVNPQMRVVVDGLEYEVHTVANERTQGLLPTAYVSRVK